MSSTASRKHKKRSGNQNPAATQMVMTMPPPPVPKRSDSTYDQPRQAVEKEKYSDDESWRASETQGNISASVSARIEQIDSGSRIMPRSMRGERDDHKDEYYRSKLGISRFVKKNFFKDGTGYDDQRDHEQYSPPGQYPLHNDRGDRPSKDSLMRENDRLEEANHKLSQTNAELIERLHQARLNFNKSAATTDRMQRTMDNKEHFLGDQALDDDVKSPFLRLMANIRTWTSKLEPSKPEVPDFSQLDDTTKDQLLLVVPSCLSKGAEYWASGKKMRMLFRGWLGYLVSQDILRVRTGAVTDNNNASDFWLPRQLRSAIAVVEDVLGAAGNVSRKSFNNWRALSFELLSTVAHTPPEGEVRSEQEEFASRVMGVLKPFIPAENEASMRDQLIQTIFIEAVKFSRLLRKQRPAWLVVDVEKFSPPKVGSTRGRAKYLPAYMEDDGLDHGQDASKLSVKMFISPALVKRGNSEGEDYDSLDCVVKALVVTA